MAAHQLLLGNVVLDKVEQRWCPDWLGSYLTDGSSLVTEDCSWHPKEIESFCAQWLSAENSSLLDGGSTLASTGSEESFATEVSVATEVPGRRRGLFSLGLIWNVCSAWCCVARRRTAFRAWRRTACRAVENRRAVAALFQAERLLFQVGYLCAWRLYCSSRKAVEAWPCPRIESCNTGKQNLASSASSTALLSSNRSTPRGPFVHQGSCRNQQNQRALLRGSWNRWRLWLNQQHILTLSLQSSPSPSSPPKHSGSSAVAPLRMTRALQPRSSSCSKVTGRRLPWERNCQRAGVRSSTPITVVHYDSRRGLAAGACRGRNVLPRSATKWSRRADAVSETSSCRPFPCCVTAADAVGTPKLSSVARCHFESGNAAAETCEQEASLIWDEFIGSLG